MIEELVECRDRIVLDVAVYYCAGKSTGELMSSFGRVRYERSHHRRRNCGSVFPADARFGLIDEFLFPLAAPAGFAVPFAGAGEGLRRVVLGTRRDAAGFWEASSGTISLYDATGTCLRTVCYGRMPEARKMSRKGMWSQKRSTVCVFVRTFSLCSSLTAHRTTGHRFYIAPLVSHDPDSRALQRVTC